MDSPILKAALQAGILAACANILAQLITSYQSNVPFSINASELFHFTLFSFLSCPLNYVWQGWLEASFPGYTDVLTHSEKEKLIDDALVGSSTGADTNDAINKRAVTEEKDRGAMTEESTTAKPQRAAKKLIITNTAIKFCLDQTVGTAANTVLFIAGIALLRGNSFESIQQDIRAQFWPMIFAGLKLWPLVSVLSFTVVPFESRTLLGSIAGLFWGVYLSLISGGEN